MADLRLPKQDSATGRGLKTAAQAGIGTLVLSALMTLAVNVWNVPGVPDVVIEWVKSNAIQIAVAVGLPSGIVGVLWNLPRKNVPNY